MTITEEHKIFIKNEFNELSQNEKYYSIYEDFFINICQQVYEERELDVFGDPNAVGNDDDFTAKEVLEFTIKSSMDFIKFYIDNINKGYSEKFVKIYANLSYSELYNEPTLDDYFFKALKAIGNTGNNTFENPAYKEVYTAAKHQGKTDMYAHYLSEYLIIEPCYSKKIKDAEVFELAYNQCIDSGKSEVYSKVYARELAGALYKNHVYADIFATSYENKVKQGASESEAWCYADDYLEVYSECPWDPSDDQMNEHSLVKVHAKRLSRFHRNFSESDIKMYLEKEYHRIKKENSMNGLSVEDTLKAAEKPTLEKLKTALENGKLRIYSPKTY